MNEFHHVHRATPLLRFWTAILALFTALILNINASGIKNIQEFFLSGDTNLLWLVGALALFVLACAVVWWGSGLWWRAMGFRIGEEEVAVKSGVVSTQLRTARFDRIQAVDVVEPVIARIFRLAKVRIETAGGGNSALEILYLPKTEAEQIRDEVIARSHGEIAPVDAASIDLEASLPEEVHTALIAPIPVQRSLGAAMLHPSTVMVLISVVVSIFMPGGLGVMLPVFFGFAPWAWGIIDKSWDFTATLDDDSLNVSYGLADKRRQTVPLDRIHGVKTTQPLLWRIFGWWRVDISVAGYGEGDGQAGTTRMLPVGTRAQAVALLVALSPLESSDVADVAVPEGAVVPDFTSPKSARWVSPVDQAQQAVTLIENRVVVVHSGRFARRMSVVAPEHIQELSLVRGPIAQALGLASIRLDLVPGPVTMTAEELLLTDAQRLLETLRNRSLPPLVKAVN